MSSKNNKSVKKDRRAFLKKAAATGISGAALSLGVTAKEAMIASAVSDPQDHWEKHDKSEIANTWDFGQYHTTSVGWYGATYEGDREGWCHDFRVATTLSGRDTNDPSKYVPTIQKHRLWVTAGTLDDLKGSYLPEYYGATPSPDGDNHSHEDFLQAVMKNAITTMVSAHPITNFAWTAAQTINKLSNWGDSNGSYAIDDTWDYSTVHADASHIRWIEACTRDEGRFDIGTESWGKLDRDCSVTFNFKLTDYYAPEEGTIGTLSTTSTTKKTNFGTTLFRPKEGWLVEKIPAAKIEPRGRALGFGREQMARLQDRIRADKPIYFAHKAPIGLEN
ncbi:MULTISPECIES: twin-arginine translocation signal domain-containing protein [Halorussus]|uniref:twin-arginine translocation signal domain-containing protein n=1 Tax=Halorussus TaxID=1070314 RepID=UPI0020A1CF5B|nr:twin-arginine translocation signal domain-containing protein [Halorussus vallis]USZ76618.1 twin-arginine translocation signal domain-containing protein [Halorussus vallis]